MALRFALLALFVATATAVIVQPEDTEKAKEGMLKLMNLGYGIAESVRKTTHEHAYRLGENMGMHIADDQEKEEHSVETKLNAARDGMKDSIQEATSLLQEGVHEARGIMEDEGIHVAMEQVMKPIRNNPQFGYFASFLEENLQKGDNMVDQTLTAMENGLPDEHARSFLKGLHSSFVDGAQKEQEKQLEELKSGKTEMTLSAKEHGDKLQLKANSLIEKAAELASVTLDTAPEILVEATKEAKKVQEKSL